MISLPIDNLLDTIVHNLRRRPNLVIEAPPGAGKTTRVPPAIQQALGGATLVLEPRRLAARLAARRAAAERGEPVGASVGYQVRFEEVGGRDTRLWYLTEGVLVRRLLDDPELGGVRAVVLDEFHERHLEGDVALALLLHLQRTKRPDLRLVAMSATLDAAPVARHLGGCPVVRSEGRRFELDIRYTPHGAAPLEEQVAAALSSLLREGWRGGALIFLPGAAEIRRALRVCSPLAEARGMLALPLYGDLPPEEQERAVAPAPQPKVIFSTNVAESSVTIEGITAVIDSGLARVATDSPWTGLPALTVRRVSQASCQQRAGRAGRTAPGRVIRLFSRDDYARRPARDEPEILRRELSQVWLSLLAMGVDDPCALPWLDAPPKEAVQAAAALLRRLGAVDRSGNLTSAGAQMARYPLHPRLSRLVMEAARRGTGTEGCRIAAVLSAGERLASAVHGGRSDVLALLDQEWMPQTGRILQQIENEVRPRRGKRPREEDLLISILAAFPDRVCRRRAHRQLALAGGGAAALAEGSIVRDDWLVAVDIEERRGQGHPLVRLASGIDPEWLIDLFPEEIRESKGLEWNKSAERVEASSGLWFGDLAIVESREGAADSPDAWALLAGKAIEAGWERFADAEEIAELRARIRLASQFADFPSVEEKDIHDALASLCQGIRSFAELKSRAAGGGLAAALLGRLGSAARAKLEELAPTRLRLPSGRNARVHYAEGQPPWVASRLQDFFGMRDTPKIAGGRVPLVVHLLAPNQRPVQTTTDLAGFWERLYPAVRRQLMRRYPKHAWPERP